MIGLVVARCDSTRLPGKVLLDLGGRPMVDLVIARARRAATLDRLVVATTDRAVDEPLVHHAADLGVEVFRGDADDVAGRLVAAAGGHEWFCRLNADSPFLDAELIDAGAGLRADDVDLVSNLPGRSFPYGVSVEIVRTEALTRRHAAMSAADREHVTVALYDDATCHTVTLRSARPDLAGVRLTVDDADDLARMHAVAVSLGDDVDAASFVRVAELARRQDDA